MIEMVLGSLIAVGLLGGYAAFVAAGEMAVAYFIGHFPYGLWPLENKGEEAVLYCFAFLYMATQGSGTWSVDAARGGNTGRRRRRLT
jgi:putative oxidoreductase